MLHRVLHIVNLSFTHLYQFSCYFEVLCEVFFVQYTDIRDVVPLGCR